VARDRRGGGGMMVRDMFVKRLYVVNDDAEDVDMAVVSGLLSAMGYEHIRYVCRRYDQDLQRCEGGECDHIEMLMDRICIDEMEFKANVDLDDIIDDLDYVDTTKKADIGGMLFIAEVEDGYVYLERDDIINAKWKNIVEEFEEGI
jgi:hypothetical protein